MEATVNNTGAGSRKWWVLAVMSVGTLIVFLDNTVGTPRCLLFRWTSKRPRRRCNGSSTVMLVALLPYPWVRFGLGVVVGGYRGRALRGR